MSVSYSSALGRGAQRDVAQADASRGEVEVTTSARTTRTLRRRRKMRRSG